MHQAKQTKNSDKFSKQVFSIFAVVVSEVIQDNRKYIKKILIKKLAVWKKVLLVVKIILLFCTCNKTVY